MKAFLGLITASILPGVRSARQDMTDPYIMQNALTANVQVLYNKKHLLCYRRSRLQGTRFIYHSTPQGPASFYATQKTKIL